MKNLAGVPEADKTILEELYLAGIPAVKVQPERSEVPYTYIGKIGDWELRRAWYYWIAKVPEKVKGFPLKEALELHYKKHPTDETQIMGKLIRSGGHGGGPSPDEYGAQPIYDKAFIEECKSIGIATRSLKSMGIGEDETEYPELNYGQVSELCNEGKLKAERYVDCYHIDDQIGLNEFVKAITAQHAAENKKH
jgi:hypothetical protein